ncbi:MAG: hypothetical protein JNL41_15015 [Phenylobacterium sp.]|uniref:hypothetical protein n=1 Tax=Phenylobacterium sp. TaxID=1871053 RepID=UPI001A3F6F57|nr:hypothetical protein [Phenylobacterium sp.]MBL8555582.1 hypothetical protein [Phenylobacterium sp.]
MTFRNPETVQLVDLGTLSRSRARVSYDHIMIVRPKAELAEGRLSHLLERHEADCAAGTVRRLSMAAVMIDGDPDAPAMTIEDDPWTPGEAGELAAVCGAAAKAAETTATIEDARRLLDKPPG